MMKVNGALNKGEQWRREPGPALSQNQVVPVLNSQACGFMNKVNRVQQFLQVQGLNVPGMVLPFENGLQCSGGTPVSTTRVVKYDREVMHRQPPALREGVCPL